MSVINESLQSKVEYFLWNPGSLIINFCVGVGV